MLRFFHLSPPSSFPSSTFFLFVELKKIEEVFLPSFFLFSLSLESSLLTRPGFPLLFSSGPHLHRVRGFGSVNVIPFFLSLFPSLTQLGSIENRECRWKTPFVLPPSQLFFFPFLYTNTQALYLSLDNTASFLSPLPLPPLPLLAAVPVVEGLVENESNCEPIATLGSLFSPSPFPFFHKREEEMRISYTRAALPSPLLSSSFFSCCRIVDRKNNAVCRRFLSSLPISSPRRQDHMNEVRKR